MKSEVKGIATSKRLGNTGVGYQYLTECTYKYEFVDFIILA
jgi:hypothetical protein